MNATKIQYEDDLEIPIRYIADGILSQGHYKLFILRATSREMPTLVYYTYFWIDKTSPTQVSLWKDVPKVAEIHSTTDYHDVMTIEDARAHWIKLMNSDDYIVTPVMYK
jgi:hypothetical protein